MSLKYAFLLHKPSRNQLYSSCLSYRSVLRTQFTQFYSESSKSSQRARFFTNHVKTKTLSVLQKPFATLFNLVKVRVNYTFNELGYWSRFLFVCGSVLYFVSNYFVGVYLCVGPSMEPTISSLDVVLAECLTAKLGYLKKNDIVICRNPEDPDTYICKRILSVAGETIPEEKIWQAHINSVIASLQGYADDLKCVPEGHVWLEGDNFTNSIDSRYFGPVPLGLVKSRVLLKIWPPLSFCNMTNFVPVEKVFEFRQDGCDTKSEIL